MPTTIAPSLGNDALFTQGGAGTSPGYDAIDLRRFLSASLQEGVIDPGSYKVTERAAGTNLSVDIAASTGDGAYIEGDAVAAQGLYHVPPHTALINETITAADATSPRIDQVVLEQLDDTHDSSGSSLQRVRVVRGTTTAGATLDNRSGAAALPSTALRLADVLVGPGVTSITNANIRDRRPWARGAYYKYERLASGDYTTTSTFAVDMDPTNMKPRLECSGNPLRITLAGNTFNSGTTNRNEFRIAMDGGGIPTSAKHFTRRLPDVDWRSGVLAEVVTVPTAGSHVFAVQFWVTGGTGTVAGSSTRSVDFIVEEILRPSASNG